MGCSLLRLRMALAAILRLMVTFKDGAHWYPPAHGGLQGARCYPPAARERDREAVLTAGALEGGAR